VAGVAAVKTVGVAAVKCETSPAGGPGYTYELGVGG
jgi:hypothetical protein